MRRATPNNKRTASEAGAQSPGAKRGRGGSATSGSRPAGGASSSVPLASLIDAQRWARPTTVPSPEDGEALVFWVVEVREDAPVDPAFCDVGLTIYGLTPAGSSVVVRVGGVSPYFYFPVSPSFDADDAALLREALASALPAHPVRTIELVSRAPLVHYRLEPEKYGRFVRVSAQSPSGVTAMARLLHHGGLADLFGPGKFYDTQPYESNVTIDLRFMVDRDLGGGCWCSIPAGAYQRLDGARYTAAAAATYAALSTDIACPPAYPLPGSLTPVSLPPGLRVICTQALFRRPSGNDSADLPILSLVAVTVQAGLAVSAAASQVVLFLLDTDRPRPAVLQEPLPAATSAGSPFEPASGFGAGLLAAPRRPVDMRLAFPSEAELLEALAAFILLVDPDIISGFDAADALDELIGHAEQLRVASFGQLSRLSEKRVGVRKTQIYRASWVRQQRRMANTSNHEFKAVDIPGRIVVDMRHIVERDERLRTYSLAEVYRAYFGAPKETLQEETLLKLYATDRERALAYVAREAMVGHLLLERSCALFTYVELARVTGLNVSAVMGKGQMIRFWSQLLRFAQRQGFVVPASDYSEAAMIEGPVNWMPDVGFHTTHPVAVLDFASLYPSLIIAYNLCYSTLLHPDDLARLPADDVHSTQTVGGTYHFVKSHVKKGIVPQILEHFLAERRRVRADLAQTTDPMLRAVLDGRQLAYKVSANAIYGFTGAQQSKLQCLPIAESTIKRGATWMETVRRWIDAGSVEGYEDCRVVYGDTDSFFVRLPGRSVQRALEDAKGLARALSLRFPAPVRLEFEKVYAPLLLQNRKRYAGLMWRRPEDHDGIDVKGLESTVRSSSGVLIRAMDDVFSSLFLPRCRRGKYDAPFTSEDRAAAIAEAVERTKAGIFRMLSGDLDMSAFIMTKGLWLGTQGEDYKARQEHVALVERMKERDPSVADVQKGERVAYVFVKRHATSKGNEKTEDPTYALLNGLSIDLAHYLRHQLREPLTRIFELLLPPASVTNLFTGEHTLVVAASESAAPSSSPSRNGGAGPSISSFLVKTEPTNCLGCRARIPPNTPLCDHCAPRRAPLLLYAREAYMREARELASLQATCAPCQGTLFGAILCENAECSVFFRTHKGRKDLERAAEAASRLAQLVRVRDEA